MRRGWLVAVALAAAMAAVPTSASAGGAHFNIDLKGTNGMRVYFSASTNGKAAVTASRGVDSGVQFTTYQLDSAKLVTHKRIVADFGPFGELDVRYRDNPGTPKCALPAITGTIRGVIRFRGEGGYTRASARRVEVNRSPYRCEGRLREPAEQKAAPEEAYLLSCRPEENVRYLAVGGGGGDVVHHDATIYEKTKRLEIRRIAQYFGKPSSFRYVGAPTFTATAEPASPFSGTATYADQTLAGDLSASFLGLNDPVPLAPAEAGLFVGDEGSIPSTCRKLGR